MANPCGVRNMTYAQDMAIVRTRMQWAILIGGLILLFMLPLFVSDYIMTVLIYIAISIVAALGLSILTGYCGQISLGHAAFMMIGAFSGAIFMSPTTYPITPGLGLSFWAALPLAGLSAGLVGLIFGLPSVRVKGFYLALSTLAAQFIVTFVVVHYLYGKYAVPITSPTIGGINLGNDRNYFYLAMGIAVLVTFFTKNLARTKVGRALVAIRDNENAAKVMGINVFHYKLLAFFVACFLAGIAGHLWATYMMIASVDHYTLMDSIWYLGILLVGGLGSIAGTIMGVVFIRGLRELSYIAGPIIGGAFPALSANIVSAMDLLLFSLVVILFVVFEPRGLYHRWELFKVSYRLWPFARV